MTPQQLTDLKDLFSKQYGRLLVLAIIGVIIAVGVVVGNRLQQDRHTGNQVTAWHQRYSYLITDLTDDFTIAQKDSKADNSKALAADCTQIENDATKGELVKKIPDATIQSYWSAALEDDAVGGKVCVEAINESSQSFMQDASTDFNRATTNFEVVSKDFQKAQQEK